MFKPKSEFTKNVVALMIGTAVAEGYIDYPTLAETQHAVE